jgi:hypothetical protein
LTIVSIYETMAPWIIFWRLSEAGPNNLGLACTDDGLLLGHTSLIERRGDRFVVRERGEIERLLKRHITANRRWTGSWAAWQR